MKKHYNKRWLEQRWDISRARFMAWVKDFYKLEKVYTKEDPKE